MTRTPLSPSNRLRRRLCPGSMAMEAAIPETTSAWAELGRRAHEAMANPHADRSGFTDDQIDALERAAMLEETLVKAVRDKHMLGEPDLIVREHEFPLHSGLDVLMNTHPDVVYVWRAAGVVAVWDYKFGWGQVDTADDNEQLQAYLAAVSEEYEAEVYYAAIIQPGRSQPPTIAPYTAGDLRMVRHQIIAESEACHAPNAPRRPHPDACGLCKGLLTLTCLEARLTPCVMAGLMKAPEVDWRKLTPDQKCQVLDIRAVADKVSDLIGNEAKGDLSFNPDCIPGWTLRSTGSTRELKDVLKGYERLTGMNLVDVLGFIRACKLGWGAIESEVAAHTKTKKAEAKRQVEGALDDLIESKEKGKALKRV